LPANRIHFLREALGRAPIGSLEEHVLDEVRDAGVLRGLVSGAAREPHAYADRAHV
jgi:hypothetical protein